MSYIGKTPEAIGGVPLMAPMWFPSRAYLPVGYTPLDGQTVLRSVYPDAWAEVNAGRVPVVSEAAWSTATNRGSYTVGDGSTTFRLPDFNGKSVGSLGAVFTRGDGTNSAGANGVIQADSFQGHYHNWYQPTSSTGGTRQVSSLISATGSGAVFASGSTAVVEAVTDGVNGTPRIASETRPLNVTGCWAVKLFGTITPQAVLDAAALATEVDTLQATVAAIPVVSSVTVYSAATVGSTVYTAAHGMGDPSTWRSFTYGIECITAELGYSVGDRVYTQASDGARVYGVNADATNVRWLTNTSAIGIYQKTTAASSNTAITTSRWRFFATITK